MAGVEAFGALESPVGSRPLNAPATAKLVVGEGALVAGRCLEHAARGNLHPLAADVGEIGVGEGHAGQVQSSTEQCKEHPLFQV